MLTNYIKIGLRNLARHRFFSLLNVFGLAVGMSACLTLILIIRDQLSYDHFHPLGDRIYRVGSLQADGTPLACAPYPLGETLSRDYGVGEKSVRLVRGVFDNSAVTERGDVQQVSGLFVEPSFFQVFGFELLSGNAANALTEPNTVVLSEKTAARLFGTANPLGQTLTIAPKGTFRVTGVTATPPGKTHLDFDCLLSVGSLATLEQAYPPDQAGEKVLDNWENHYMSYLYVVLKPGQTEADLNGALQKIADTRAQVGKLDHDVRFFTQSLGSISPRHEQLANELGAGAPWFFIWGLMAFVAILTIFPCINYANLAISQALSRAREVGVRKAVGAYNRDVKRLILVEAMLTSLLALGVAGLLHLPLNHFVAAYFPPQAKLESLSAGGQDWLIFIGFSLLVGLLAGWIPARRLSKLHPAMALRGNSKGELPGAQRFGWRTALLVGQFAFSLILVIVVATLWSQMQFMSLADYGFQKENLLTIELQGAKGNIVAAEIRQDPRVLGVTTTSLLVASNNLQGMPLKRERGTEDIGVDCALVDENYVPVMGLQVLAGANFPANTVSPDEILLLLNEKAVERFELGTPAEAVGQTLWVTDSTQARVCGVLKDFHYRILEHGIQPFALQFSPTEKGHLLHVRLTPGDPKEALSSLGAIWKKVDGIHPFQATFLEASMQKAYGHITFVGGLISFFALLSLSLACLGLLGMVTYNVSTRVKEIGVRKVLGATTTQVTLLLSRRFLILLGVAVGLALPAGWALANLFLSLFAYRISVGVLILGGCTALLLLLGLCTVGVQASRAAVANPVDSLRSE